MEQIVVDGVLITVDGYDPAFQAALYSRPLDAPGLYEVTLRLRAPHAAAAPAATLSWELPAGEVYCLWHPLAGLDRGLPVEWTAGFKAAAATGAPVACLIDPAGRNRLAFALSDALHPALIKVGVHEESGGLRCIVRLFAEPSPPLEEYNLRLWWDARDLDYAACLREVSAWWAAQRGYKPAPVPEAARVPVYSTWYSFHQSITAEAVEEQCRLARQLGCEVVILDDGWQTEDQTRGYAYCGDWEAAAAKFPDMRAHVDALHAMGLKVMLWFAVPFVGIHSRAYARFRDQLLGPGPGGSFVLDPRSPAVREHLVRLYERALREWDLDGLKLDFIDRFILPETGPGGAGGGLGAAGGSEGLRQAPFPGGRDSASVPEAVDRLLGEITARLRQVRPDLLVEFRQKYVGPLMRRYGNMFRAADSPRDALTNRVRTLDLRLLAGETAVHADMVMWHPEEPVESAAMQLVHTLYAVPQISVRLEQIPPAHLAMLRFWLSFWRTHRDVLLGGWLTPCDPAHLYPTVVAGTPHKRLVAVYGGGLARPGGSLPPELLLVNGTYEQRLVLELEEEAGNGLLAVWDCCGNLVRQVPVRLGQGLHSLPVPPAGVARFRHA